MKSLVYFIFGFLALVQHTSCQLLATRHPLFANSPALQREMASQQQFASSMAQLLSSARMEGLVPPTAAADDATSNSNQIDQQIAPHFLVQSSGSAPAGRPGAVTMGSDGQPIENPMITMFRKYTKPDLSAIPAFFLLIAPFLFGRGLYMPETPQYFVPSEPRPGAWREPFPFVLPSSTPTDLTPPL
eukprot:c7851_g2_i1.p1 GENE.c7851_g2_i1~~c7851_g2_i1.p1  ORF type:complete len:187 (+),score=50.15 c7851_g2_i1:61-621(+)